MKKFAVVFIGIAVIAGAGIGIYKMVNKPGFPIETVLPADAVSYIRLHDVEKNFQELAVMPFWQGLRTVDIDLLVANSVLNYQQGMFIRLLKQQLSDVVNSPLSKRLFGKEIAFAVYPFERDMSALVQDLRLLNPKSIEELFSGLALVTRIGPDVQLVEWTSTFFDQFGPNVSRAQVPYKEETIHVMTVSDIGMKFGIVRLKDLLVIGVGERAARTSIDVFKRERPSLAADSRYGRIQRRHLEPSAMNGFVNFDAVFDILKQHGEKIFQPGEADNAGADVKEQWGNVLAQTSGIKALGFSSQLDSLTRVDSYLIFDPKQLDAAYAPFYTCPSIENKTIHFVPGDVLGYQWSNCFRLDYYWNRITEEMKRANVPASQITGLETQMGVSVEQDILPAFGEEIGGYLQNIQVGGFFPAPNLLLFIQIRDKAGVQRLLDKLQEQPMIMLQEENYKGTPVKYLALPLGQNIQPGYCFLKDYLLISTSLQLLKDSIDASANAAAALPASPVFKEVNFGLTNKNRSVQFLKVGQIIEKVKGIIQWSNRWITSKEKQTQAFKAGGEKPLEEVEASIADTEQQLQALKSRLILLEDEVWNMETKKIDTAAKQAEVEGLRAQMDAKETELAAEKERKEGLADIVEEYQESAPDPEKRQLVLDEFVYPLLEGFKSIKSYGLRSTVSDDTFESSVFLKIE